MSTNTIWITNYVALRNKYGQAGAKKIWNALNTTGGDKRINLANPGAAKFPAVTNPTDAKQNKNAIDGIYAEYEPNYIAIVGAPDVVPFQRLRNLTGDEDGPWVPSDLPYACSAKYSTVPSNFRAPTRVVGRVPDLVGGNDADYLVNLLNAAKNAVSRPADDYMKYLGISAKVWSGSTKMSLGNIFGDSSSLNLVPPKGPNWTSQQLGALSHFINCHGANEHNKFYGEPGNPLPAAESASQIAGKIAVGTVVAAECCYGAQLYNAGGGQSAICNTYLSDGAYAFVGASNIAYGPATGNGQADLITQFFLKWVLSGASLGRAMLQARLDFVNASGFGLDPVSLKTLSQFYLLGAPNIHPVQKPVTDSHSIDTEVLADLPKSMLNTDAARKRRRQDLIRKGLGLAKSVTYTKLAKNLAPKPKVASFLKRISNNLSMKDVVTLTYSVHGGVAPKSAFAQLPAEEVVYLMHGTLGEPGEFVTPSVIVVARELDGHIPEPKVYQRK